MLHSAEMMCKDNKIPAGHFRVAKQPEGPWALIRRREDYDELYMIGFFIFCFLSPCMNV